MRFLRLATTGLALLAVSACRDAGMTSPGVDLTRLIPMGSAQVVIQQEAGPEPGTMTFVVRVLARRDDLAAYQGSVRFAPGSFELLATLAPEGVDGEMHLVNAEPDAGRIRFAAFATEDFATTEAFRFVVRPTGSLAAMRLGASLDVAGIVGGAALEAAQLNAADGVRDRLGRLIE